MAAVTPEISATSTLDAGKSLDMLLDADMGV